MIFNTFVFTKQFWLRKRNCHWNNGTLMDDEIFLRRYRHRRTSIIFFEQLAPSTSSSPIIISAKSGRNDFYELHIDIVVLVLEKWVPSLLAWGFLKRFFPPFFSFSLLFSYREMKSSSTKATRREQVTWLVMLCRKKEAISIQTYLLGLPARWTMNSKR